MISTQANIDSIIALNKERKEKYFRKYDPIIGDPSGETTHREKLRLDGVDYYIPTTMMSDPFIRAIREAKGNLSKICAFLGLTNTEQHRQEIEDLFHDIRYDHDFEFYAAMNLMIQSKTTKQMMFFVLNPGQRVLIAEYERQRRAGLPIRVILVKARQWGGSTATEMYMLWLQTRHYRNWHSCIIGKIKQQSTNIRSMYSKALKHLPAHHQRLSFTPWEGLNSVKQIPERGCKIGIFSAQNPDAIRSDDVSMVHMSEVGLWKDTAERKADDVAQSVYSCVPDEPGTFICLESTAKGVGNFFHENYITAEMNQREGHDGLRPVFVAWWQIEMYSKPIKDMAKFISTMTAYNWWQWEQGATLEGINWYNSYKRAKKYNDFQMKSEFPTTADEAFQSSAAKFFTEDMLHTLKSGVKDPVFIGDIRGLSMKGEKAMRGIELIEDSALVDNLKIWIMPDDYIDLVKERCTNRFVVVVDIGGTHYKSDYSVITVLDRFALMNVGGAIERAALWRGHIDHDMLAWKAVQIAIMYNNALLVIESNTIDSRDKKKDDDYIGSGDHTYTVLNKIEESGYTNLYYRQAPPETAGSPPTSKIGWHMNHKTKWQAYDAYFENVRDYGYVEHSMEAYIEASYLETGKKSPEAMKGKKDDIQDTTAVGIFIGYDFNLMPIPKIVPVLADGGKGSIKRSSRGAASF